MQDTDINICEIKELLAFSAMLFSEVATDCRILPPDSVDRHIRDMKLDYSVDIFVRYSKAACVIN